MPPWHRPSGSTGASAPLRFPGTARSQAPCTSRADSGVRSAPDSDAPARGGRLFAGLPPAATFAVRERDSRRGKARRGVERRRNRDRRACRTRMVNKKGNSRFYGSAKSCILNTLRATHGGPCGSGFNGLRREPGARTMRAFPQLGEPHPLPSDRPTVGELYQLFSAGATLTFSPDPNPPKNPRGHAAEPYHRRRLGVKNAKATPRQRVHGRIGCGGF